MGNYLEFDPEERVASDWSYDTVAEFDGQMEGVPFAFGLRLFQFESEGEAVGAWVLYNGFGPGVGYQIKFSSGGARLLFEAAEYVARPGLRSRSLNLGLPRRKLISSSFLSPHDPFSLAELNGAEGDISSAGSWFGRRRRVSDGERTFGASHFVQVYEGGHGVRKIRWQRDEPG